MRPRISEGRAINTVLRHVLRERAEDGSKDGQAAAVLLAGRTCGALLATLRTPHPPVFQRERRRTRG